MRPSGNSGLTLKLLPDKDDSAFLSLFGVVFATLLHHPRQSRDSVWSTFFSTISGISEKICRIEKIGSSLAVSDVPRSFSFREPKKKNSLGVRFDLGYKVDAALFWLLPIRCFLKKVLSCDLAHSQDARE
jgi:hypothetical protein